MLHCEVKKPECPHICGCINLISNVINVFSTCSLCSMIYLGSLTTMMTKVRIDLLINSGLVEVLARTMLDALKGQT